MNRALLLFCLALITFAHVNAQGASGAESGPASLSGRIFDSITRKPVPYATITIYKLNGIRPLNGGTADEKGNFRIDGLDTGAYKVLIDFIGYNAYTIPLVRIPGHTTLGKVMLSKEVLDMQTITIVGKKPLVENRLDKMIYNVEKDLTAQGGVATDALRKVPQVTVDVDGNVELQGNSDILFLINGKPSSIFGNNLADALQSIPASQIKSIEVITSPGAKYDAEGTGGIINIILKDNKAQGINTSLNLAAGSRLENGSLNVNARKGSFGVNAYFSGNAQLPSTTLNGMNRVSQDTATKTTTTLLQNGNSDFRRGGYETGVGFDWSINSKNSLTGSIGYDRFGNNSSGIIHQNQADTLALITQQNHFLGQSLDYSLGYKKTFNREDQELDVLYEYSYGQSHTTYGQDQQTVPAIDSLAFGSRGDNPGTDKETDVQLDYTQPLGKGAKLEAGGKVQIRKIYSASDVFTENPGEQTYAYDSSQSNTLRYNRHVYAGYASLTVPLGKIADARGGIRYERTETDASFSSVGKAPIPGYNTVVPSFLLSHKFDQGQTLRFTYTKRIQRPGYRSLNPFVNASDPKNITVGNPYLQPEIGNNFELAYLRTFKQGSDLSISLYYHHNTQDIQPYVFYYPSYQVGDSVYQDVAVSTYQNIGSEKQYGLNISGSLPIGKVLDVRCNVSLFDKYIVYGTTINSFNYRINANASYTMGPTWVAEAFGSFNSARTEIQGKYPSFTNYTIAVRKQFWHKKGSLGLTATNPFGKYVNQTTQLTGTDFTLTSYRNIPYRSFGISFTWKFGKLEFKEKEKAPAEHPLPTQED